MKAFATTKRYCYTCGAFTESWVQWRNAAGNRHWFCDDDHLAQWLKRLQEQVHNESNEYGAELQAELTPEQELATTLGLLEDDAKAEHDGHLTIMRFTTGWKAMLGTPAIDTGRGWAQIAALRNCASLEEAVKSIWCSPGKCSCWKEQAPRPQ